MISHHNNLLWVEIMCFPHLIINIVGKTFVAISNVNEKLNDTFGNSGEEKYGLAS